MKKALLLLAILSLTACKVTYRTHYRFVKEGERTIYTNSYLVQGDTIATDEVMRGNKTRLVKLPVSAGYKLIHN